VIIHRCQIQNFDLEFGFEFKVLDILIQRSFFAGRLRWKSFFVSCGENVLDEKFVQVLHKSFSKPFWETQNRPLNIKCLFTIFFGDRFVRKEVSWRTYKPSSQELGVGGRVSFETSFDTKQPTLEPKRVSALSETKRFFRLFRF
jgi:hypothetical protein